MSKYGAKGVRWAPFAEENAEPDGALPKYQGSVSLGHLMQVTDNPTMNEAKGYGDNRLTRHVVKFKECPVTVGVNEFSHTVAASLFGSTLVTAEGESKGQVHFNEKDQPPYGGLAFFYSELLDGGVVKHTGVFYPKLKAAITGQTYDTNGENLTLGSESANFTAAACNTGDWKILSDYFDTEEEAEAWILAKLPETATS